MKRVLWAAAAGLWVAAGTGGIASAYEDGGRGGRLERMAERLGITEEQGGKLKEAFKARRAAVRPLREERRETFAKLKRQVKEGAAESDLKASMETLKRLDKAIRAETEKFRDKVASILDAKQQAKFVVAMHNRKAGKRGGGRGHGRGFGGRGEGDERDDD